MNLLMDILSKIGFDWQVALANLVNFVIIFFLLKRFAFGPIKDLIRRRQETIKQGLDTYQEATERLAHAERQATELTDTAKKQANEILAQAHAKGKTLIEAKEREAQEKGEQVLTRAQEKIEQEKRDALQALTQQGGGLVVDALEKVLATSVNEEVKGKAVAALSETLSKK